MKRRNQRATARTNQRAIKLISNLRSIAESLKQRCIDEEACRNPDDGAKAGSGPTEETSSGFGGLGLEGIVGMVDPGEGKSGAISGDNSV